MKSFANSSLPIAFLVMHQDQEKMATTMVILEVWEELWLVRTLIKISILCFSAISYAIKNQLWLSAP